MGAARWWARGGKPGAAPLSAGASKVAADLAAFGAPKELVKRWAVQGVPEEDEKPAFLVRPDCWNAVRLFCALETQWAWVGAGLTGAARTGLRYEAVEVTGRLSKIAVTPSLFTDLRIMETAALNELAAVAREEAERMERDAETPKKARKRKRGK